MIILTIAATALAIGWSMIVVIANGMRSSPGEFYGLWQIVVAWVICGTFWLAWWFA